MNTSSAAAKLLSTVIVMTKLDPMSVAFVAEGRDAVAIKAGTTIVVDGETIGFADSIRVALPELTAGTDYEIWLKPDHSLVATPARDPLPEQAWRLGGFHHAPGGNATARGGGDDIPAINPFSLWDIDFQPACGDARGMALIDGRFWADIYLTGADHLDGTSKFGVAIADGYTKPVKPDGGRFGKCDYQTAVALLAHHGKTLLTYEEFCTAAHGLTERSSTDDEPETTGLDVARTSQYGLMQATGNMWVWITDGDPDEPRASLAGGSWLSGSSAGSRCASLGYWPGLSGDNLGVRGRSDHLTHG